MKRYTSSNAHRIRQLLIQLNKYKILPHGFSLQSLKFNSSQIQEALLGRSSKIPVVDFITTEAERILKLPRSHPPKISYKHLTIADLVKRRLLPLGYGKLVAELSGNSTSNVFWLVKKQLEGSKYKAPSQPIVDALYQVAAKNKERELVWRLEQVVKKAERNIRTAREVRLH